MLLFVDIEADGPCPGIYSMVQLGAVSVYKGQIQDTFCGNLAPMTEKFLPEALKAIDITRERTLEFPDPKKTMFSFDTWAKSASLRAKSNPLFMSDNNGFDWQFVNYYMHYFIGSNFLGFSSNNISNFYGGLNKQLRSGHWKNFRVTKHTHDALDDARGNAEAFITVCNMHGMGSVLS